MSNIDALKGKLSENAMNALLAHLGNDAPVADKTTQTTAQKAENTGIEAKIKATEGLDVQALEHDYNTNAGVTEDFGLSQFWYTTETAKKIAEEAFSCGGTAKDITGIKRIAFLSCPSAFKAALDMGYDEDEYELYIFEYDTRFGDVYGDKFVFFDFSSPYTHEEYVGLFDFVVADPPYLTDSCAKQTIGHMKRLARDADTPMAFCTGTVMAEDLYNFSGFRETKFHPEHHSKLGNEFSFYTNYPSEHLGGWYPLEDLKTDFNPAYYKEQRKLREQEKTQEEQKEEQKE